MIKFSQNSAFTQELRNEVKKYFLENHISEKGNIALYFKTFFWITTTLFCYTILVFFTPTPSLSIPLCVLLGFSFAGIGFNVMHDAGHGSYSKNKVVNTIFAHSLNLLGANAHIWDKKHNITHHTYTNTDHDDDIHVAPMLRMSKNQKWYWWYRFQTLYMWILYAIEYIGWIIVFDLKKYFQGKACNTNIKFTKAGHWIFWLSKVIYFTIFVVLPMFIVGVTPTLIGYGITAGVCGVVISIVFQLAHVHEKALFPTAIPTEKEGVGKIEKENAIHQIETTANFATQNPFISWYVGGLNFQVEHHLFPNISHVHYPKIRKIVRQVCNKYSVKYHEFPTFFSALISHVKQMWKMSIA